MTAQRGSTGASGVDDPSTLRIVEIGDKPMLRRAFPDAVVHFSTSGLDPETDCHGSSVEALAALWRALRDPALSLVVCHPTFHAPWQWQGLGRAVFNRRILRRPFAPLRAFGPQMLRRASPVPIAVVDHEDLPLINRNNLFLLRRAAVYFKRELPPDRWRLFLKTAHPNLPTPRFRERSPLGRLIPKIQPISLGLPMTMPEPFPVGPGTPKTADLFFAGRLEGRSSIRRGGMGELLALRERGFVVDVPEAPLPQDVFLRRCASAWMTWSPEGLGWDCFRHYEAAACGSVPLINQPAIERHRPLIEGIHAVHYDVEPGGLTRAVLRALSDRPALARCAQRARDHVLEHHTPRAIARHIVWASLRGGARDGSVPPDDPP